MKFQYPVLLFLLVITIASVSAASIGAFQLNIDDVELYQTCNNCTSCNFTRVMGPNNQTLLSNLSANKDGTYFSYNVDKGNFSNLGSHKYCYECGNEVALETGCIDFEISHTGRILTLQIALVYLVSLAVLVFLFFITLSFREGLPNRDSTDEDGIVLQISNLKHLRPVMLGVAWGLVIGIVFIVANLALGYLPSRMVGNFLWVVFQIMFWVTIILVPLWFIKIFTDVFRDQEFKRMIERGVDLQGLP